MGAAAEELGAVLGDLLWKRRRVLALGKFWKGLGWKEGGEDLRFRHGRS